MQASRSSSSISARRKWTWLVPLLALALAVVLWAPMQGAKLRQKAAAMRLDQGWQPSHRIVPLMQMAYHQNLDLGLALDKDASDELWAELGIYRGSHPEFFWLGLALMEARSGRLARAKKALARAEALEPKITGFTRGPIWDQWRGPLGLGAP